MKKVTGFFKRSWIILSIIAIILLPMGIKMALKIPILCEFLSYEEQAKDIIDIYVSVFSMTGTLFLGFVAYRQNEVANMLNGRLIQLEEISKKAYIKLDEVQSKFVRTEDGYECDIYGENISGVPIVNMDYDRAGKIVDSHSFKVETIKRNVAYSGAFDTNTIKMRFVDPFIEKEAFVFCFKLILTGVYGYKTTQIFNIVVKEDVIYEIYTG